MSEQSVPVLFAQRRSIYKRLPGFDVWDVERDALLWPGGSALVAHPPCRAWGRLRALAKVPAGEREACIWVAERVREFGGVLEHPAGSLLWSAAGLPSPGERAPDGGYTLVVDQSWFGHRAPKRTWLYVQGVELDALPPIPYALDYPEGRVELMGLPERERTPVRLALWLGAVARSAS